MTLRAPSDSTADPIPGPITRFLWFCAGADASVLRQCPISDWVRYQGIGGIVFATTTLAFVSASYAFYTVFSPKTATALSTTAHLGSAIGSFIGGLVWSLVIFNIDRFIVSSTGKGDGTEKITRSEFVGAIPRLIMAVIIGVCISAPLEVRILKPEIDAQLELEQNQYLATLNEQTEARNQARRDDLVGKIEAAQKTLDERANYFESRRLEIQKQRQLLELEAEGKSGAGVAGRGPAWRDKKTNLDKMEAELERDKTSYQERAAQIETDIDAWKKSLDDMVAQLEAAKVSNLKQSRHLDGLLRRIHISHQIGGVVPWVILLLLLAVETGPIFFKMMMPAGPYDYLQENKKRMVAARAGIELDAQIYLSETQEEIRVDVFHGADALLAQEKRRLQSQAELNERVHERLRDEVSRQLASPDGYKKYVDVE